MADIEEKCILKGYIKIIQDLYEGQLWVWEQFVRSHLASLLELVCIMVIFEHYLFALIMEYLMTNILDGFLLCMLFTVEMVLIIHTKRLTDKLEIWRKAFQRNELKLSNYKTKYRSADLVGQQVWKLRKSKSKITYYWQEPVA